MSRSYKGVRVKKHWVYSVPDLCDRYNVCANTVSNWVISGLVRSDCQKPHLFRGAAVIRFHKERAERTKKNLRPGEFKCLGCKMAVFPLIETLSERKLASGAHMFLATCPDCTAALSKVSSDADRDYFQRIRNPNTSGDCQHEENGAVPAGIGIKTEKVDQDWWSTNDRLIYKWQTKAERYDVKTADQHLAAIRYCEGVLDGKPFDKITASEVGKVRSELKRRAKADAADQLSKSSILHTASHLSAFFSWLIKQDGYKRLPKDIADYLDMPMAMFSTALPRLPKEYPSLEEAEKLLVGMPFQSLQDQRSRAIFALAFLGALRADTLVSVRLRHVDTSSKMIIQDGTVVRSKRGKSLNVKWFPIPEIFSTVVIEWVQTLTILGFNEDDALFPSVAWLSCPISKQKTEKETIPPMSTIHAVTKAFSIACRNTATKYTPHSAKHTIAAERNKHHLTQEQRKAWSENMGHEKESTTEQHYGTLSDDRRFALLEDLGGEQTSVTSAEITELKEALVEMFSIVERLESTK